MLIYIFEGKKQAYCRLMFEGKKQTYCRLMFEGKKTGLLQVNILRYYYMPIVG
jgi:hypothetical protein